jgi:hypothetical protein
LRSILVKHVTPPASDLRGPGVRGAWQEAAAR